MVEFSIGVNAAMYDFSFVRIMFIDFYLGGGGSGLLEGEQAT